MATEVEIKAHVYDVEGLRAKLTAQFGAPKVIQKQDYYYRHAGSNEDNIRLRLGNGQWVVTYKERHMDGGIECNNEIEFGIDQHEAFASFLHQLQFGSSFHKQKDVELFCDGDLAYELCYVHDLGWFIEIEQVCNQLDEVEQAKIRVYNALMALGIAEKDIAPLSYKKLLGHA
jgi:predicted adenylyl cyclase CyaB